MNRKNLSIPKQITILHRIMELYVYITFSIFTSPLLNFYLLMLHLHHQLCNVAVILRTNFLGSKAKYLNILHQPQNATKWTTKKEETSTDNSTCNTGWFLWRICWWKNCHFVQSKRARIIAKWDELFQSQETNKTLRSNQLIMDNL